MNYIIGCGGVGSAITPSTPEQAVDRFASWNSEPSGDWVYFCTVHHHCSADAFQSGTDEQNEKGQDGLHLTVGRMDEDRHDLHARFYLNGSCFEPDMSLFWPIDAALVEQVPSETLDALARFQMCEKVTVDFPDAWRVNIVEIKTERMKARDEHDHPLDSFHQGAEIRPWIHFERALLEITQRCEREFVTEPQWLGMLQSLCDDPVNNIIIDACSENGVTPEELLEELSHYEFSQ